MYRRNNSGRTFKSFGRLSKKELTSIKNEYKANSGAHITKTAPIRLSDDKIELLIPAFDPVTTTGLSAAEWIASIENLRLIFDWDDCLTLLYASRRLEGDAKRWFAQNFCKWPQFKVNLQQMFPHAVNKGQIFEQLIHRSKDPMESYEKYAFDVERMAMKCSFDVETTINYMITGLGDSALRTHLVACNCKTITELLFRIQCFNARHNSNTVETSLNSKLSSDKSEFERPSATQALEGPRARQVSSHVCQDNYRDLMTTVKVKEAYFTAFVSLDSDFTTMRFSELKKHDLKMKECDETVHVFDSGPVRAIGCLNEMVTAGEVMMLTKVLVVEDSDQMHSIILGRNFLINPKVCIFKSYRSLEIRYDSSVQDKEGAVKEVDDGEEKKLLELLDFIECDL